MAPPPPGQQVIFWGQGGTPELAAQVEAEQQTTSRTAGTRFRAHIRYRGTLSYETLTLKPIHLLRVVIRNQAVQTCYTGNCSTSCARRTVERLFRPAMAASASSSTSARRSSASRSATRSSSRRRRNAASAPAGI